MPDGILMGVYTVNRQPEAIGMHFRRRVMSCKEGSGMIPSPVANIFPEDGNTDSMVSIRISTYVSLDMMTEDQKWCRAALMAMSRQNESIHGDLVGLITKPEVGLDVDVIGPAFTDFKLIVESDFWKRANWRENSS